MIAYVVLYAILYKTAAINRPTTTTTTATTTTTTSHDTTDNDNVYTNNITSNAHNTNTDNINHNGDRLRRPLRDPLQDCHHESIKQITG